ncbi:MAG: ABC transporter permease subunit [Ardenticatenaceae bacterium]|nr:ABC transporter permease subunit [Ardenticatenaceae bacterium]HBY97478.1 amino acid ABC transporter permease [Chloroflexota bacterium]
MTTIPSAEAIPFWRDVRILRIIAQVIFVIVVLVIAWLLVTNMLAGLKRQNLGLGFSFLSQTAGFGIGESAIPYQPTDTYWQAFLVGIANTLRASLIGIVLATILGILAGVARLSSNWLVSRIASTYIEIIRNTPLLVQLVFWYTAFFLKLPTNRNAVSLPGSIYLSNRGVFLPWPVGTESFGNWWPTVGVGLILAVLAWVALTRHQLRTGHSFPREIIALVLLVAPPALAWLLLTRPPVLLELPVQRGLNFRGGVSLTPEFTALLLGLTVYTGAFIAEIVRAGILAVPRGQTEAARALGLSHLQVLRLVIFPQALRVIIPPLTSQYLNLTKNSSLAVAIGYPDLFGVAGTIFNQTGQAVPVITLMMGTYLSLSLITSLLMNIYNARVRLVER